jgi:hypothetical protein
MGRKLEAFLIERHKAAMLRRGNNSRA